MPMKSAGSFYLALLCREYTSKCRYSSPSGHRQCKSQNTAVPDTLSLTLYAVVVLYTLCGVRFVYRTTNMHGYLVGYTPKTWPPNFAMSPARNCSASWMDGALMPRMHIQMGEEE